VLSPHNFTTKGLPLQRYHQYKVVPLALASAPTKTSTDLSYTCGSSGQNLLNTSSFLTSDRVLFSLLFFGYGARNWRGTLNACYWIWLLRIAHEFPSTTAPFRTNSIQRLQRQACAVVLIRLPTNAVSYHWSCSCNVLAWGHYLDGQVSPVPCPAV